MRNLFIVFIILFISIAHAQTENKNDKGLALLEESMQLLKTNNKINVDLVQKKLETIVYDFDKSPALEQALFLLGTLHMKNGNNMDGQLYLKKMLKKYPNSINAYEAHYLLFRSFDKMKNNFQKNIYLKKIYQENPDGEYTPQIICDLLKLAVKEENYKIGIDYINKALSLGKNIYEKDPIAFFSVGEIYYKNGDLNKAFIIFERLINLYGNHSISYLGKERLAECYETKNDYNLAKKFYLNVFVNHKNTDAYALSVIKLTNMISNKNLEKIEIDGKEYKPLELLNKIIKNKIKYNKTILPMALLAKCDYLFYINKTDEALILLKNIILKYPNSSFTELSKEKFYKNLNNYIKETYDKKEYYEVIHVCEETKTLIHTEYDVLKFLGDSYYAMGSNLKAEQVYKKLIKSSGKKNLVKLSLFDQAELDYSEKKYAEAGRGYQLFVANFSESKEYRISITKIVEILSILKKYDEATKYFEQNNKYIDNKDLQKTAYYYVAKSYSKLNSPDYSNAKLYFTKYLELNPENINRVFEAKMYILNREIISETSTNTINRLDELLQIKEDSFVRFLKIKEFTKMNQIKNAEDEAQKFKKEDYWSNLAKEYIENYKKTGTLTDYEKLGIKIFKTPFD